MANMKALVPVSVKVRIADMQKLAKTDRKDDADFVSWVEAVSISLPPGQFVYAPKAMVEGKKE